MTRFMKNALRRFASSEEGNMVVPFALWTPVFVGLILSSIELGTVTVRHTALERALDSTVRDVRLGTGTQWDHAALKTAICDGARILPDCETTLHLEMVRLNVRDWSEPPRSADCVDTTQEINPLRSFEIGGENEMMFLRACYKYRPITPAGTLSSSLPKDDQGYTFLVSSTAFVQEPL